MVTNHYSDVIVRLNYGIINNCTKVNINFNNKTLLFINCLLLNGFISGFKVIDSGNICVYLKYINNSSSLKCFKLVSKKTKKIYYCNNKLVKDYFTNKRYIISTNKGLIYIAYVSDKNFKCGGEVICEVR